MRSWLLVLLMIPALAVAEVTELGDRCFETTFADTLTLHIFEFSGHRTTYQVNGFWAVPGVYQFSFIASANLSADEQSAEFGPAFVHNRSDLFGGHDLCRIQLTLELPSLDGLFTIICLSDSGGPPFIVPLSTIRHVSCEGTIPFPPASVDEALAELSSRGLIPAGAYPQ